MKPSTGFTIGALVGFPLKNNYSVIIEGGFAQKGRILKENTLLENHATYKFVDGSLLLRKAYKFQLGESIPAEVHAIIQNGLRNVLTHCGVLKGEVKTRAQLGKPASIMVASLHEHDYLLAPESGIFEAHVSLGKRVEAGELIASIHFLERPDREPLRIEAQSSGFLLATRAPCLTQQGDCIGVISEEVDAQSLRTKSL